ncbi:MAG: hypothetical protein QW474_02950 [Candidatus Aenigmatarchaeota archaeon]
MPTTENDYIKIRKRDILSIMLILVVFAAGFFLNDYLKGKGTTTDINTCKQFCDLAGVEFAFVKDKNCYCYQRQIFYNQQKNKTVEVFQAVNIGILKNMTTTDGLTQEARNLLTANR